MPPITVEILHIDECANWEPTVVHVQQALTELGWKDVTITTRLIVESEDTVDSRFAGSPTIIADGVDLFPTDSSTRDLACRVYQTESGLAGSPSTYQILAALRAAQCCTR